jgi:CheY-like chemotaxis protein
VSIPPTLLLADDSLTIQRVVSLTFADQPVRLVVAKDGQDAINRMAKDRPDVVLADTNMPCVDGYELARWVRQQPHLSAVPVLLLAGVTDPVDEQRLHDSGANGVLEKPFEPSHVISRVKELLGMKSTPPATATRLVTPPEPRATTTPGPAAPQLTTPTKPKSSGSRPAAGMFGDRHDVPAPPSTEARAGDGLARGEAGAPDGVPSSRSGGLADVEGFGGAHGDPRDWFGGVDSPLPPAPPAASLADELGVSGVRFYGQGDDVPASQGLDADFAPRAAVPPVPARASHDAGAAPADVFASLLAAETGDAQGPVVVRTASAELTAEALDYVADRVVERMASDARAAVAEAVQSAVNGTILGSVRGAVNEAVQSALPAAVEHQVAVSLAPALRDAVSREVRESIGPLVQQAVREVLRESAERLISEEIARIRERRS